MRLPSGSRWKAKAAVHAVLGLLPRGEQLNYLLQKGVSGAFSEQTMLSAFRVQVQHIVGVHGRGSLDGARILEVGPGWYSKAGVLFWLLGARTLYWVDTRRNFKLELLLRYARILQANAPEVSRTLGLEIGFVEDRLARLVRCRDEASCFGLCGIEYQAPGDARRTSIPAAGVDLIYSYGVLEHIPWDVLRGIMVESRRILAEGGRHYHNIGLHDHFHSAGLGNGVNFLRYPSWQWNLIAGNKFAYHNRKRRSDYLRMIDEEGFAIAFEETELLELNLKALDAMEIDEAFAGYQRDDLAMSHMFVELTPQGSARGRSPGSGGPPPRG